MGQMKKARRKKDSDRSPYDSLLSVNRRRKSSIPGRDIVLESESDRSRLVFSAPFRRLQQKAQVFSLESNAAVRSRLTHSLEVAQIGRFIADQICQWLIEQKLVNPEQARSYVTFVETACLMHDIGNPPFGHFGEAAISSWFHSKGLEYLSKIIAPDTLSNSEIIERVLGDFLEFDGNSQGLRIVALLQWNNDEYGLNLTYSSLASYLKYIRSPKGTAAYLEGRGFTKKPGFFSTEIEVVREIWNEFGYDQNSPQRFPLAYVMEAADDIAYCISDLEDSIEKYLLDPRIVFGELAKMWEKRVRTNKLIDAPYPERISRIFKSAKQSTASHSSRFTNFRTALSQQLTIAAAQRYIEDHDRILSGACSGLIDDSSACGQALDLLKTYCRENVYSHYSVHKTELGGHAAIIGLLDKFGVLLGCNRDRFKLALNGKTKDNNKKPIVIERKLLALFPEKYVAAYRAGIAAIEKNNNLSNIEHDLLEWNLRAHLITDYISGMTDDYALETFQNLTGIKAG